MKQKSLVIIAEIRKLSMGSNHVKLKTAIISYQIYSNQAAIHLDV